MKRIIMSIVLFCFFWMFFPQQVYAVENPLAVPNNKFGIHILFPEELDQAARLVNGNGGDWGYVTIPIQAGDKNLIKWQAFMDSAKTLHVIPIVRLATEGDYFNTKVWRKPEALDVLDFANFLNSLDWPTKNRYVIIFNEVNRGNEWGGSPNPEEYTDILHYASIVFKSKSQDFFIIAAGLDNAAENIAGTAINEYDFIRSMYNFDPDIFNQIDGLGSHSYPNPGFTQPPSKQNNKSIASFRYERSFVENLGQKRLPIFITETGWSENSLSQSTIASYYQDAFTSVWLDDDIIAVTPFLLRAGIGEFTVFSFIDSNGSPKAQYATLERMEKVKGNPKRIEISPHKVLGETITNNDFPKKNFIHTSQKENTLLQIPPNVKILLKWLLKI